MASEFFTDVEATLGPLLRELGFFLDDVDDGPDEGGLARNIIYYRSKDCKLQIYYSAREGEINCMIAPLDAPNEFGLNSNKWHLISRFSKPPDIPLREQLQIALAEVQSYEKRLDWVKDRIIKHYEDAHAGILEKYGSTS
jgi:hypothetical protein